MLSTGDLVFTGRSSRNVLSGWNPNPPTTISDSITHAPDGSGTSSRLVLYATFRVSLPRSSGGYSLLKRSLKLTFLHESLLHLTLILTFKSTDLSIAPDQPHE